MRILHILLAILVAAIWGTNFVFVKLGLNETSPLLLCTLRFLFVSIPVVFFLPKPKIPLTLIIYYGMFTFAIQFSLLFLGMHMGMPAGLSSIILQVQVFFSLFLAAIFLNEKLSKLQIIGSVVSFSGLALIVSQLSHTGSLVGFVLEILGAASWATGNLVTKKVGRVNSLSLVAWGCLVSTPPLIILTIIIDGPIQTITSLQNISWLAIAAIAYITYISTWLGYGIWNWLISLYPVASVMPFSLLVPIFGMIGSSIVFNEPMQTWKLNATYLVICGLCINIFGPRCINYYKKFVQLALIRNSFVSKAIEINENEVIVLKNHSTSSANASVFES